MRVLFTLSIIFILINSFIVTNECSSEKILKIQKNIEELNLNYPVMFDPIYIDDFNKILNPLPYQIINTPEQYNWKNQDGKDWTTPAKNQDNCGSCWDFAAIGTLESIIKIRENRPDINPDLSEQYVLSCLPMAANFYGRGCSGGSPYKAFYYMMNDSMQGNNNNGALPESCFPYQADDDVPCSEKCENWQDYLIPITDCGETMLGIDNPEAIEIIKSMIYQNGPIAAGINVTQDFVNYWSIFHDENKYYPDTNEPWGNRLNHIIVIVGWKDDINIENGGYWICKNSWGTDWGYDGFFNIEYGGLFIEAYISWVDYQPNNQRPERPSRPIGKTEGNIDSKYYYSSSSVDPNGDQLYFIFDWGDGTDSGWIGPYESNEIVNISHIWNDKGNYEIKTKVKDTHELESEWSKPLTVSMPMKNKNLKLLNIIKNYNIFRITNLFQEISIY
jgi:C1A family cysteine protease